MTEYPKTYEIFKADLFTDGQLNTLYAIFMHGLTKRHAIANFYGIDLDTVKVTLYKQNAHPANTSEKGIFGVIEEETGTLPRDLSHAILLLMQYEIVREYEAA